MPQQQAPRGRHHDESTASESNLSESFATCSRLGLPPSLTLSTGSTSTYAASRSACAGVDLNHARRGKSKSVTTLDLEPTTSSYAMLVRDDDGADSISMYHEVPANQKPLKERRRYLGEFDRNIYQEMARMRREGEESECNGTGVSNRKQTLACDGCGRTCCGQTMAQQPPRIGKFRYVVATLIILSVTLNAYATNTMYIAAIEMISNDVLQSGLTTLRAKHLSNDPLAVNKNAALPGTCPVEATRPSTLVASFLQNQLNIKLSNASEISAHEQLAMKQDTEALYVDINQRLKSGQLVDWSIQQRGYVFTAHTIGTILLAVPVSWLGLMYGLKVMIFICIFLAAIRMAALPTMAGYTPFWATFVFEMVIGGVGGNIIILGYPIAAAWLLPHEANFFVAINILSALVGIAATNFVSTQLLAVGLAWCWCYYIPGIFLFLLSVCWFIWGSDRPETSRFVSRAELELLQSNTIAKRNESLLNDCEENGADIGRNNQRQNDETLPLTRKLQDRHHKCRCPAQERASCPASELKRKPNWTVIFTCPTMWALILVQFANHWTTKNATLWPTFFSNVLHIDSSTIGIMLGIKGVWALVFGTIFVIATKTLVIDRPFNMSLTAYRRWNQAIATTIFSTSVALTVLMDCDILANFIALLILPLVSSFNSISHDQMPLDLSAEDSGLLVSVIRLLSIGDIVALPVSSYILSHAPDALAGDRTTWKIVWLVGFAVRFIASFYFVLVAKSQPKSYSRLEPSGPCKSFTTTKIIVTTTTATTSDKYV